ncbi:putative bifunctional diguanylate cyclase/phosphodiesterase [Longimicrobium terrae]|uniref:Diguanylate cyclase (GGDEF)-like protein/PAS domain S-box-containing protein n=1 Tax=Longimicrobium terrae TaxID=1639882 RepID=A0A841GXB5_9BACT|nr:EAL domain-containing protein [Longimicrobium terrae]MBB4635442.1 diguanylate cyclase (GGDEF)-like protein/PAS domain S-box-containing protein [Longimicrobium terrae]MBB6069836.1 diguanylate cyclase (GGDEF)-like protein/PAS domain S-box-containing protein [Longimicrobium terrae]NNC30959.1 EAL domain-containing protein [Longimicrobium terrae]NNC32755.1 EAL domain-containing protein [Longimicrobium terrae]
MKDTPRVLLMGGSANTRATWRDAVVRALPEAQVECLDEEGARAGSFFRTEAEYRVLVDQSPEPIFIYTAQGVEYANPAAAAVVGMTREEAVGRSILSFIHPDDRARVVARMASLFAGSELDPAEYRIVSVTGEVRHMEAVSFPILFRGQPAAQVVARDVTERRKAEESLRRSAFYDALTGLPNRRMFLERLREACGEARTTRCPSICVMFVDLDRLKSVNDTAGHRVGDELLREVAARLLRCAPDGAVVSRFGGDEFLILLPAIHTPAEARGEAERLLASCFGRMVVCGHELYVSASIGIALGREDDSETLVHRADMALNRAKAEGRHRAVIFDPETDRRDRERLAIEAELPLRLRDGAFRVHYQPIVQLDTGRIAGVEALARWPDARGGWIAPDTFVPIAEELGLVGRLDAWVMGLACTTVRAWPGVSVSVNVSALELSNRTLVRTVEGALRDSGLPPALLALELTERALIQNPDRAAGVLRDLKSMGVYIHLDDFGTGYSSLRYIERLPIDTLKIDRSFLAHGARREIILRGIVSLAHDLGMHVIAEGVESAADLERLRELGSDYAQGYYFCRPRGAEEVQTMLAESPVW